MKPRYQVLVFILCLLVLSGCIRGRHRDGDFYFGSYSEAEAFYNRKDYGKALQRYQAYIDENPEGNLAVISQYYMAKSHAALGHKDEAAALYKKIVAEHPDLVWANFSEAQLKELQSAGAEKPAPAKAS